MIYLRIKFHIPGSNIQYFSLTNWKVKKILHAAILLFYIQHKHYSIKWLKFFKDPLPHIISGPLITMS
jgi:hypothetical protein